MHSLFLPKELFYLINNHFCALIYELCIQMYIRFSESRKRLYKICNNYLGSEVFTRLSKESSWLFLRPHHSLSLSLSLHYPLSFLFMGNIKLLYSTIWHFKLIQKSHLSHTHSSYLHSDFGFTIFTNKPDYIHVKCNNELWFALLGHSNVLSHNWSYIQSSS